MSENFLNRPRGEVPPPSLLDNESTSARSEDHYSPARKRYRRMYHRVMSGLERKGNVRLLTLTSSPKSRDFQRSFRILIMRLKRRGLVEDYIRVPELTKTGLRHDHVLFRGSYIEQQLISRWWESIHSAPVVDIRRTHGRSGLASYLANYLAKSPAGRYSYSWGWVWKGFAYSWKALRRKSLELGWSYKELLTTWRYLVIIGRKPEEVYLI